MATQKDKFNELTTQFGKNGDDTGSSEAQIAIFSERIKYITNHLQSNKKDHSGRRGLVALVSKRRRLLNYLKNNNLESYKNIYWFKEYSEIYIILNKNIIFKIYILFLKIIFIIFLINASWLNNI